MSRIYQVFSFVVILSLFLTGACNILPVTPNSIDIKPIYVTDLVVSRPSYQGIIPSISSKRDVLAKWGDPNVIRTCGAFESLHYFDGQYQVFFLIKEDTVRTITTDALREQVVQDGYSATLDGLSQALGPAEVIRPTLVGDPIYVFSKNSLAVSGYICQLFEPTSQPEYQTLWGWGKLPLEYDPFPLIPSVEEVGIILGQTTRSQVAHWLGNPDRIEYEESEISWLYYVEPDMLGTLFIVFDPDTKVDSMYITPSYQRSQPLRLGDVVEQYGTPDMLQLLPDRDGSKYASQGMLYLERGLRVTTRCRTPACDTVEREAIIGQKWYYPPQTLTEYQTWFRSQIPTVESAYIEWPGFAE